MRTSFFSFPVTPKTFFLVSWSRLFTGGFGVFFGCGFELADDPLLALVLVEPPELLEPAELGEPAELPDVVRVALLELAVTGLAPPATVPPLRVVAAVRTPPVVVARPAVALPPDALVVVVVFFFDFFFLDDSPAVVLLLASGLLLGRVVVGVVDFLALLDPPEPAAPSPMDFSIPSNAVSTFFICELTSLRVLSISCGELPED